MNETRFEGWDNPDVQALLRAAQEAYPHLRLKFPDRLKAERDATALSAALLSALHRKQEHDRSWRRNGKPLASATMLHGLRGLSQRPLKGASTVP
jgi:hypothetical protein